MYRSRLQFQNTAMVEGTNQSLFSIHWKVFLSNLLKNRSMAEARGFWLSRFKCRS